MKFAISVAIAKTEEELKAEEKKQKSLEKKLLNLQKDKEGYHKEIEDAKAKIAQAEANIEQNIKDQQVTTEEVSVQQGVVKMVKERLEELKF